MKTGRKLYFAAVGIFVSLLVANAMLTRSVVQPDVHQNHSIDTLVEGWNE